MLATGALLAAGACSGSSSDAPGGDDAGAVAEDASAGLDAHVPTFDAGSIDASQDAASAADANVGDSSSANDSSSADAAQDSADAAQDSADEAASDAALDAGVDADAAVDCGIPPVLHPAAPDAGPFCPFSTAAPPFLTCAYGQHCCEPPNGSGSLSTCASDCSTLADGGTDWQCQDPLSCPAGQLCCANATSYDTSLTCGYGLLHVLTSTVCASSCSATQFRLCESNVECPSGTTCTVVKAKGADFGVCR
jgi:hypothetical protein